MEGRNRPAILSDHFWIQIRGAEQSHACRGVGARQQQGVERHRQGGLGWALGGGQDCYAQPRQDGSGRGTEYSAKSKPNHK